MNKEKLSKTISLLMHQNLCVVNNGTKETKEKPDFVVGGTELLNKELTKLFSLYGVVDSKRFTETDLLNGYQAGCIEGLDDYCDLGLDDLKEIKEDGEKWVKRYTE